MLENERMIKKLEAFKDNMSNEDKSVFLKYLEFYSKKTAGIFIGEGTNPEIFHLYLKYVGE